MRALRGVGSGCGDHGPNTNSETPHYYINFLSFNVALPKVIFNNPNPPKEYIFLPKKNKNTYLYCGPQGEFLGSTPEWIACSPTLWGPLGPIFHH